MSNIEQSLEQRKSNNRLFTLDLLKAISIVAVVAFHSNLLPESAYSSSKLALFLIFSPLKFCVPVLLTISFFLMAKGLGHTSISKKTFIQKRLVRILIPTLFWFGLISLFRFLIGDSWIEILHLILIGRIFTGAYYLLVLIQLIPIFTLLIGWLEKWRNWVIIFSLQGLVFLLIPWIASSQNMQPIMSILRGMGRPFIIYWFVYMALGVIFFKYWPGIVRISKKISILKKLLLVSIYICVQIFECYSLYIRLGGEIPPFDYVTFSCILSVFVFFICFASIDSEQVSPNLKKIILILSRYSLGIFCINGTLSLFLTSLSHKLIKINTPLHLDVILISILASWILVTLVSLMLSYFLDRCKLGNMVR